MSIKLHIKQGIREMYSYRQSPENMRAFADFYWHILLYSASVITLVAISFGIFELSLVLQDFGSGAGGGGGAQSVPALNRAQLKGTLESFQERQARFESLKASAPRFGDPSK